METLRSVKAELMATTNQFLAVTERLNAIEMSTVWRATHPLRLAGKYVPSGVRRTLRRAARIGWWTITLQLPHRLRGYLAARAANQVQRKPEQQPATLAIVPELQATAVPAAATHHASLGAAFVVAPSGGYGGPLRLPAPKMRRALVIDSRWPRPDRDSGSLDAVLQARSLRRLGYEVVFAGDHDYAEDSPYRTRLEADGVICLAPSNCPSIEAFLHSDGGTVDLCVLSRVYSGGRYLEAARRHAPRAKIVFNTVDLHHLREEREARLAGDMAKLHQAQATRERELYIVRQADATIVVSATEHAVLEQAVPGAAVFEMPLARPVCTPGSIDGFEGRNGVGFVGGFEHQPNVDAVRYLLTEVWPRVLERLPDAQLFIVGDGLPEDALAGGLPGVRYLGALSDLSHWFDTLRLTVAPLRFGAGAKGKVASSLAAGVPCVGTTVAAEGMRLQDGLHIAVGDTPEALAARICDVHENPALWAHLSAEGHKKARTEFSIEAGEERLAALLRFLDLPAPAQATNSLVA
jgi:glycosyltransferase involved in cell wall biosynthesis